MQFGIPNFDDLTSCGGVLNHFYHFKGKTGFPISSQANNYIVKKMVLKHQIFLYGERSNFSKSKKLVLKNTTTYRSEQNLNATLLNVDQELIIFDEHEKLISQELPH